MGRNQEGPGVARKGETIGKEDLVAVTSCQPDEEQMTSENNAYTRQVSLHSANRPKERQ